MRRILACTVVASMLLTTGCGGCGVSQDDMRKHAIHRPSTDDESTTNKSSAPPSPGAAKPKAGNGAQNSAPRPGSRSTSATANSSGGAGAAADAAAAIAGLPPLPDRARPVASVDRRRWTIENLTQIGKAMALYLDANNFYPTSAMYDPSGTPLLSWRVELLPYLGYGELYNRFHLNERWDSQNNLPLLAEIPPVYQSPERFDDKTNYLATVGSTAIFFGKRNSWRSRIKDGPANTLLVVEVDDGAAVPWTRPTEYDYAPAKPMTNLGGLREDGFFVVWGDGEIGRLETTINPKFLASFYVVDNEDSLTRAAYSRAALPEPAVVPSDQEPSGIASHGSGEASATGGTSTTSATGATRVVDATGGTATVRHGTATARPGASRGPGSRHAADEELLPVPDDAQQQKSLALLHEVYKDDFDKRGKREDRRKFASKLLSQEQRTREDPAGRYVLLREAAGIAADAADVRTAMRAVDRLERSYQVDALSLRVEFIERANTAGELTMSDNHAIVDTAEGLIKEAMSQDNYASAEALYDAAIAAARRTREKSKITQVTAHREDLDEAKAAFREVSAAIETLRADPDDPGANLDVGKYLCFVKQRWDRGLPHLARGSDVELRGLANLELQANHAPEQMIEIADLWWKLGEKTPKLHRKWLWLRAAYWYQEAMPLLPGTLLQLHAETQLKRAEEEYGKDEVAQRPVS